MRAAASGMVAYVLTEEDRALIVPLTTLAGCNEHDADDKDEKKDELKVHGEVSLKAAKRRRGTSGKRARATGILLRQLNTSSPTSLVHSLELRQFNSKHCVV